MQEYGILRRNEEFRRVYAEGETHRSQDVVLVFLRTGCPVQRVGVVASRKVGIAVRRNRAKRLLREAHRSVSRAGLSLGADIVLIARPGIHTRKCADVAAQLESLYRRAGLLSGDVFVGHDQTKQ